MKKMQCEVCGSIEIKKISDNVFECQRCGVQYDASELKKMMMEVTGSVKIDHSDEVENKIKRAEQFENAGDSAKAAEYYNAALDMDADNKIAQQRIREISTQQELQDYFLIEPDIDPKDNVRDFLNQLAGTRSIACDIYKEIAIKSVTEKYMSFYFMKAKYRADWSATACHVYYENETVYEKKYNSKTGRSYQEPVTKKVKKVQRIPRSGSNYYNAEELVLASHNLSKLFSVESETAKKALLSYFENQQDKKYSSYNVQRINTLELKKEDGKYFYKGMELDHHLDNRIYSHRSAQMADRADHNAAPEINASIGGDYYEDLNAHRTTLSETTAYVCIPVQIIEYTYKGKTYAAVSDLLSHTTTMPAIYPCDSELDRTMESLEKEKKKSEKAPGVIAGFICWGIGFVCLLLGALPGAEDIFIPAMLGFMSLGMLLIVTGAIIQHTRGKKFDKNAHNIREAMFNPRVTALKATKELFFQEYTDYASAQNAASKADCIKIDKVHPEVSEPGAFRKIMEFVTYETENDETLTALEEGIRLLKRARTWKIWTCLLAGAAVGALGIILSCSFDYVHTLTMWILIVMACGGIGFALIGTLIILGNQNEKINKLRSAIAVYKLRKQAAEEFDDPQDHPAANIPGQAAWTAEHVEEVVVKINQWKDMTWKEKITKKHKILLVIAISLVIVAVSLVVIEAVACDGNAQVYEQSLAGKHFEQSGDTLYGQTNHYFRGDGMCERTYVFSDGDTATHAVPYRVHYDLVSNHYTLMIDWEDFDFAVDDSGIAYFYDSNECFSLVETVDSSLSANPVPEQQPTSESSTAKPVETEPAESKPVETKPAETKPVETKPAETKPAETKPVETKPAETKPAETKPAETKPVETKPVETKPAETKPAETKPAETKPAETKPAETKPVQCQHQYTAATCTAPKTCTKCGTTSGTAAGHNYTAATCTAPKTCTKCGSTSGTAAGHNYTAATCTAPKTCTKCGTTSGTAKGHNWINLTETVYHEEQGHYEDVQVPHYVTKYECYACSHKTDTVEAYYTHFDTVHGNSNHYLLVRDRYETVSERVYETVTEWVVDQEAYSETVVTGHKCSTCGETD